ncbi:hypothetical protein GCM10027614_19310 [Micromonospora vulcania]
MDDAAVRQCRGDREVQGVAAYGAARRDDRRFVARLAGERDVQRWPGRRGHPDGTGQARGTTGDLGEPPGVTRRGGLDLDPAAPGVGDRPAGAEVQWQQRRERGLRQRVMPGTGDAGEGGRERAVPSREELDEGDVRRDRAGALAYPAGQRQRRARRLAEPRHE